MEDTDRTIKRLLKVTGFRKLAEHYIKNEGAVAALNEIEVINNFFITFLLYYDKNQTKKL